MAKQKINSAQFDPKYHQSGWGYVAGTATNVTGPFTIIFPTTMAATPTSFTISHLGYRLTSGGVPTSAADFAPDSGNYVVGRPASSSTAAACIVARDAGGTVGSNVYIGFSWVAEV